MIECVVSYCFKTLTGRVVVFEKTRSFPAVPRPGDHLRLDDDHLPVQTVTFDEHGKIWLHAPEEILDPDENMDTHIEDRRERGWSVANDYQSPGRRASSG